jgi:hypothetical protein
VHFRFYPEPINSLQYFRDFLAPLTIFAIERRLLPHAEWRTHEEGER